MVAKFECGCILETDEHGKIIFEPELDKINLSCPKTWNLISDGNCTGLFQLEKAGMNYSKKLKPNNEEELSDLISLIRPGCANAYLDNGKSIIDNYILRKFGKEEEKVYHESIRDILKGTRQLLLYQEEALLIVQKTANFTLLEADLLRVAIGKKKAEDMAKMKKLYLERAKEAKIVTEQEAQEIFSWIEASQKYSFNKCLSENNLVMSQNGLIQIKEIKVGDFVLIPGDKFSKVLDVINNGPQEMYWFKFDNGYQLECTMTHKFLCEDGELRPISECFTKNLHSIKGLTKIKEFDYTGTQDGLDLEIEDENHIFYCDGMAVSNSHGIAYAIGGYLTAYAKCHFPLQFFTSYLIFARKKPKPKEEINNLINNSKEMEIEVLPPDLRKKNDKFSIFDDKIYYGLTDIKGFGDSTMKKLDLLTNGWEEWTWPTFVMKFLLNINSIAAKALISSGSLRWFKKNRTEMLYEYGIMSSLKERELEWVKNFEFTSINEILENLLNSPIGRKGGISNKKRYDAVLKLKGGLENPPYSLTDSSEWIANSEETLLGIALTCCKTDGIDVQSNCNLSEFKSGIENKPVLPVEVKKVREHKIKSGKSVGEIMAFIEVADYSGSFNSVVVFPSVYKECQGLLNYGNTVLLTGERDKEGNSLIVKKMEQI